MQITLDQDEILEAIEASVRSQISVSEDQEINITLKAGRGDNGYTATLEIRPKTFSEPYTKRITPKDSLGSSKPSANVPSGEDQSPEPEQDDSALDDLEEAKEPVSEPKRSIFKKFGDEGVAG
jgi:hypothetical protein